MARIGGELDQLVQLRGVFDREAEAVDELTRTIRSQLSAASGRPSRPWVWRSRLSPKISL